MNAITSFGWLPTSKEDVEIFVRKAKQEILSGIYDPLHIDIKLKVFEEIIKSLRKDEDIKNCVLNASDKYVEKTFKAFGATITKIEKKIYDFSSCNDSEYENLRIKEAEIKEDIKRREAFLKNIKNDVANPDTGEIISQAIFTCQKNLSIKL
jgi:hypothetical protein